MSALTIWADIAGTATVEIQPKKNRRISARPSYGGLNIFIIRKTVVRQPQWRYVVNEKPEHALVTLPALSRANAHVDVWHHTPSSRANNVSRATLS